MRKIIASLMALTITSTAAANVVSCGNQPPRPIPVKYTNNTIDGENYTDGDMYNAFNGTGQTFYGPLQPLNNLLLPTYGLFAFTSPMITNPKKINDWRKQFIGDDVKSANARTAPAVDGIYLTGRKGGHENDVEGIAPAEFYKAYETTHINSLAGLYQVYDLINNQHRMAESDLGAAANQSYQVIKNALVSSPDTYNFLDSFLNLSGQSWDSSVLSQTIKTNVPNVDYKTLDSKILSYNIDTTGEGDDQTSTYQFTPIGDMTNLGTTQDFQDINTQVKDQADKHKDEKIGNMYLNQFNLLTLPTSENVNGNQAAFNLDWEYPTDAEGKPDSDKVDPNKTWDIRKPTDADWTTQGWKINADPEFKKDDKDKNTGYIKTNESIIVPINPFTITYLYSTNARDEANATHYEITITISNLQAVYMLRNYTAQKKDADKNIGNKYLKWQFTHYQFNNQVDTFTKPGSNKAGEPGNGYFSQMFISDLKVIKAD